MIYFFFPLTLSVTFKYYQVSPKTTILGEDNKIFFNAYNIKSDSPNLKERLVIYQN